MTPEIAVSILLRNAAAACAAGYTNLSELEAAVVAAKVLAEALTPKPADKPATPKPEATE
jgi:hypothetical protein